jgi:DNA polymerase-3 subunit delta'
MTEPTALESLSRSLCPWLAPMFARLEAAHTARRLGHGWLITGPQGVGKINLALAFAVRLLSGNPATLPELRPDAFAAAMRSRHVPVDHHPDLHWLFPEEDKRSIAIEQVRQAAESLALKAHRGAAKVLVIEPAERMTTAAANALLKTLEEPAGESFLLLVSHQAGQLPATIASRCQRVTVATPQPAVLAAWLGLPDGADLERLRLATGGAPLAAAEWLSDKYPLDINGLEKQLIDISGVKIDPQAVADEWLRLDRERLLEWLLRRLHAALRERLAPATGVTDRPGDGLHNAWAELTLRTLFGQYLTTEKLLSQLGAGINVELALRALLLGFQPHRGPP